MAGDIEFYLIQNGYVDRQRHITDQYHQARQSGTLAALPDSLQNHAEAVALLIDSVFNQAQIPAIEDDRRPKKNPVNDNFERQEFKALWQHSAGGREGKAGVSWCRVRWSPN